MNEPTDFDVISGWGIRMSVKILNQEALAVAQLVQRLTDQFWSHHAAVEIAKDPRALMLLPPVEPPQLVPILKIPRRDGGSMVGHFQWYLEKVREPEVSADFAKVWLVGTVLTVGDALGANNFFNHAPEAEIIRHLRNGIAHGNRFNFGTSVIDKATGQLRYPAHISKWSDLQKMPPHSVDASMHGSEVMWTWGGPEAFVDCLTVLGIFLWNLAYGTEMPWRD